MAKATGTHKTPPTGAADRIAAGALNLAGQRGWRTLQLTDIAAEAGVTLAELAGLYACRPQILDGFEQMIDRAMLAAENAGDTPRDRLFDIVMARFDALAPYRDGIRRIARELPLDPPSGMVLSCALPRSVCWMFSGAKVGVHGPAMPFKLLTLGGVYLSTLRVWLTDDGQDLAKTMACLDRQLDRAERLMGGFGRKSSTTGSTAGEES